MKQSILTSLKSEKPQLHWSLELILGAVALGVTGVIFTAALDKGGVVYYLITVAFLLIASRHFRRAFMAWKAQN